MKKIFFLITLIVLVLFTDALPQWATNGATVNIPNGKIISYQGTIATTDTLTTNPFSLSDITNDFSTNPLKVGVILSGGTASTQKISAFLQGSYDLTNWFNVDTVSVSDSATTHLVKSLDLNSYKVPYLRIRVLGTSGNSSTVFKYKVYAYRKAE